DFEARFFPVADFVERRGGNTAPFSSPAFTIAGSVFDSLARAFIFACRVLEGEQMSSRWLMTLLCVALLGLGTTGDALAQKTKTKGGTAPQTRTPSQTSAGTDPDPNDPDELGESLGGANAADVGGSPDGEHAH